MIYFQSLDVKTFLTEYWQKKPLVIRQALPDFINFLSADELAGLSMEAEVESRIVFETPNVPPYWQLKRGPFIEKDFASLPKTHWTLLVQGVDQLVPEVALLLDHFDFIPQWRIDDIMISYAAKHGSVGPHYDNYDVFLYQAKGQRQWSLTTKKCHEQNSLQDTELRIMAEFEIEQEYTLLPGDMLYLPAHVGHHGISLDDDCMTYSFGYRSYRGQEMWDSLADYMSEHQSVNPLYCDPNWSALEATSAIPSEAWHNAKQLMQQMLKDESQLKSWFGCFATRLDSQAEQHLPLPLLEDEHGEIGDFIDDLLVSKGLIRDASCRMAYQAVTGDNVQLFINGCEWVTEGVSSQLIKIIANHRLIDTSSLTLFLTEETNQKFLYDLWILQWLQLRDVECTH